MPSDLPDRPRDEDATERRRTPRRRRHPAAGRRASDLYVIPSDALYPRDEAHRLRIYARRDKRLSVVAATDSEGLGPALLQLDADERERGRRLVDLGAIGVLDAIEARWLIMPWHRPETEN
jgi:hypothetical protein